MVADIIRLGLSSFLATFGYGIVLQAPKRSLPLGSLIGALGYLIYWCLYHYSPLGREAMFIASTVASIWGQIAARKKRIPVTVFSLLSIIPLVPGLALYKGMSFLGQGMGDEGGTILAAAMIDILMIALALAVGAFIARVFYAGKKRKTKKKAL